MTSHNHTKLFRFTRPSHAGFTLVELMIGLAIGMLATLVVMQVFSVFEFQKRATTGAGDAQTNGNIALYGISRDLQIAGYALKNTGLPATPVSALMCATPIPDFSGVAASAVSLSPVSITDGGAGNGSDSITIRYGTSAMGGITTSVTGPWIGNDLPVNSSLGCASNDVALVINGTACVLTRLAPVVPADKTLTFIDNRAAGVAVKKSLVSCLGEWNQVTYAVAPVAGNLLRGADPIVEGIVNIQAQYGISAIANSNQVANWVNADMAPWNDPGIADRNRIKAVRIAIVARSAAREVGFVTDATCRTAKGTVNYGPCAWDDAAVDPAPQIDLRADPDWQHYRYKVFETIVPLRNVIWARGVL